MALGLTAALLHKLLSCAGETSKHIGATHSIGKKVLSRVFLQYLLAEFTACSRLQGHYIVFDLYACAHMWVHVEAGRQPEITSEILSPWRSDGSLAWCSLIRLEWLTSKPRNLLSCLMALGL